MRVLGLAQPPHTLLCMAWGSHRLLSSGTYQTPANVTKPFLTSFLPLGPPASLLVVLVVVVCVPPGLRQMPEAERLETLQLLQQNRQEVEAKLSALPIVVETPSLVSSCSRRRGEEVCGRTIGAATHGMQHKARRLVRVCACVCVQSRVCGGLHRAMHVISEPPLLCSLPHNTCRTDIKDILLCPTYTSLPLYTLTEASQGGA